MLKTPLLRLAPFLAVLACAVPGSKDGSPPGETLYVGGRIYPEGGAAPVEALLVRGSRVAALGSRREVEARAGASARVVELAGTTLVPGLHDAHGHIANLGRALERVSLVGAPTLEEVARRAAERAASQPAGTWVLGRGWDQNLWGATELPHHQLLSEHTPDHPVRLTRVDGHAALLNRRALEAIGLDRRFDAPPEIPGGEVLLDADGWPTGVLVDTAMGLVGKVIPAESDEELERRLLAAQATILARGLTAVHDMGVGPAVMRALDRLVERGEWHLGVYVYLSADDELDAALVAEARERFADAGPVRLTGIKVHADGALGSRGAALLDDYSDRPGHRGLLIVPPADLRVLFERAQEWQLQLAIHAIGDRTNRAVLDVVAALEAEGRSPAALRPRIEHAQVVQPDDLARFVELGVIPSVQPTHATSDMGWAPDRLGPERLRGAYAWRDLAPDTGALALGSDFPVEDVDPLLGLYAARTRCDAQGRPTGGFFPEQRLSGAEALAGFTSGAAYAVFEEHQRGRLAPGFVADLSVFDIDPVACEPGALLGGRALLTVVAGREVWRAAEPGAPESP